MPDEWSFSVDTNNSIAVYMQIQNQVCFAIASGRLKPGDSLPSVRELSTTLDVNPNTVTKAYRELELRGVVSTRRGVGVSVTPHAVKVCAAATREMAKTHLANAVSECLAAGFAPQAIRKMVSSTISSGRSPYTKRS